MENRCNDVDRENVKYLERNLVSVPRCLAQISHWLAWDRIPSSAATARQLTANFHYTVYVDLVTTSHRGETSVNAAYGNNRRTQKL
jgi:hypothetical protein